MCRKEPLEQSMSILHSGPNLRECMGLACGSTGKTKKNYPFPLSEGNCDLWRPGGITGIEKISEGGRSKTIADTSIPWQNMIRCWKGRQWSTFSILLYVMSV